MGVATTLKRQRACQVPRRRSSVEFMIYFFSPKSMATAGSTRRMANRETAERITLDKEMKAM